MKVTIWTWRSGAEASALGWRKGHWTRCGLCSQDTAEPGPLQSSKTCDSSMSLVPVILICLQTPLSEAPYSNRTQIPELFAEGPRQTTAPPWAGDTSESWTLGQELGVMCGHLTSVLM